MADYDRLTGKGSYILLDGVELPIVRYTMVDRRLMRDLTNATNYSPRAGMFFPTQRAIAITTMIQVDGRFRISSTPAQIISRMYSDAEDIPCYFGLDSYGTLLGHGNFDITDFRCDVPIDGTIDFSCVLLGNGPFYPNE